MYRHVIVIHPGFWLCFGCESETSVGETLTEAEVGTSHESRLGVVGFASRLSHGHAPPACLGNFSGKFKKVRKLKHKLGAQKFLSLLGVIKGAEKMKKILFLVIRSLRNHFLSVPAVGGF